MIKLSVSNILRLNLFKNDKSGVTALEYGLIAALVGSLIAAGFTTYGTNLRNAFQTLVV